MSSRTLHDRYHIYQHWDFKSCHSESPQICLLKCRFHPSQICHRVSGFVRPPGATPTTHLSDRKQCLLPYKTDNTGSVFSLQVCLYNAFLLVVTHLMTTTPGGRQAVESRKISIGDQVPSRAQCEQPRKEGFETRQPTFHLRVHSRNLWKCPHSF